MISENIHDHIIESLNQSLSSITSILKSLGNEKRVLILLYLLQGPQSYGSIVEKIELKKTAVSNHLSHLLNVNLIEKGDYGIYNITGDGIEFMRAIDKAYKKLLTRQKEKEKFDGLQRRGVSTAFLNRFSG